MARLLGICGIILLFSMNVSASVITIEPATINNSEMFTVNVTLSPSEPVKAWEFQLTYDNTSLRFLFARLGGFFQDYPVFGVCNQTPYFYALIVGKGNVSDQGVVCTLTFEALSPGNTSIGLHHQGICNETRYLPLITMNGTVEVTGPDNFEPPDEPSDDAPVEPPLDEPDEPSDDAPVEPAPPDAPSPGPSGEGTRRIPTGEPDYTSLAIIGLFVGALLIALFKRKFK